MGKFVTEDVAKQIISRFATKQRGGHFACPRCGHMTMDAESVTRNALSRRADVYVCDACGMQEALEDMTDSRTPLSSWIIARNPELWRADDEEEREPVPCKYERPGWRCPICGEVVTLTDQNEAPHYCYKCPACGETTGADEWEEVQA